MYRRITSWWYGSSKSIVDDMVQLLSSGDSPGIHPVSKENIIHHILSRESENGVLDTFNALKLYLDKCGPGRINVLNEQGMPPLFFAIYSGCHESLVWLLLERGAQCNFTGIYSDLTPAEILQRVKNSFGYSSTLERFLSSGAIRYQHEEGSTLMSEHLLRVRAEKKIYVIDSELKLRDALASKPTLQGFKIDLEGVSFIKRNFSGADFSGADLRGIDFTGANLADANFKRADLRKAKFAGADLKGANFTETDLRGVNLSGISLNRAMFFQSMLKGAVLEGADLSGAEFKVVDLTRSKYSLSQFASVKSMQAVAFKDIGKLSLTEEGKILYHNSDRRVDPQFVFKKALTPPRVDVLTRSDSFIDESPTKSQLEKHARDFQEKNYIGSRTLHKLIDEANTSVRVDIDAIKKVLSEFHEIIDIRENHVLCEEAHDHSATVLYKAVCGGKGDIVRILLDAGADPNLPCGERAEPPLFIAALNGNEECIKLLIRGGASLDVKNFQGQTPLQLAEEYKVTNSIRLLQKFKHEESLTHSRPKDEDWVDLAADVKPFRRRTSPQVSLEFDKAV